MTKLKREARVIYLILLASQLNACIQMCKGVLVQAAE